MPRSVVHHQGVASERGAVAVEGATGACGGHAAVVEVVGGAALGAVGGALHAHVEPRGGAVAHGAAQVVGIVIAIAEVGLAEDEPRQAEVEDAAVHLGVGDGVLAPIGLAHLVAILRGGGTHREEVARGLHLVEGRLADVARERHGILGAIHLVGAAASHPHEEYDACYELCSHRLHSASISSVVQGLFSPR